MTKLLRQTTVSCITEACFNQTQCILLARRKTIVSPKIIKKVLNFIFRLEFLTLLQKSYDISGDISKFVIIETFKETFKTVYH